MYYNGIAGKNVTLMVNYSVFFFSASFDLPAPDPGIMARKALIQCHYCNESGHKAINCPKLPPEARLQQGHQVLAFYKY